MFKELFVLLSLFLCKMQCTVDEFGKAHKAQRTILKQDVYDKHKGKIRPVEPPCCTSSLTFFLKKRLSKCCTISHKTEHSSSPQLLKNSVVFM